MAQYHLFFFSLSESELQLQILLQFNELEISEFREVLNTALKVKLNRYVKRHTSGSGTLAFYLKAHTGAALFRLCLAQCK